MSDVEPDVTVRGDATAFVQQVTAGRHHLTSDEPRGVGGADAGASPYQLLLAALGACTSMTIGSYARRKAWPVEAIAVRLSHRRVHASDCEICEEAPSLLDRIHREIEVTGPLSAEQRDRLLEIANKCPVHRTLTSRIEIVTTLA